MSEQPASVVAREAKGLHQSLKELLKTKEPFDKEVDFQRKKLRRCYLNLLLVHPNAKESKDVENHLWMQTSYAFIAAYKQRIAVLDRAIQANQRNQIPQQPAPPGQPHRQNNHGVVEHRKLIQRFRQFLADEEKFWTQLILRLLRLFDLNEAQPTLVVLGLLSETDDLVATAHPDSAEGRDGAIHSANGRNHFQFPLEDTSVSYVPATPEEREVRLATFSKALICLGDIARYRELYNESNGRPRAGQEDGAHGRRGRNRRGGAPDAPSRPRNYDKAQQCYEQARLLVPYEGNPSHQLAILANYQKDSFASIIHYYRALCVRQPYDTAAENLGTIVTKALESWRQRIRRERDKISVNESQLAPRARIELFKERVVILHALWRIGMEKGVEKMKSISPKHNEKVAHDFFSLVADRHLPIDLISNTIVLVQGALWKHRMIRDTSASHRRKAEAPPTPAGTASIIEWSIVDHLLDLHFALLEVGKDELKDPPMVEVPNDLAQRISATFRRTLPALRIASKWLRANFKYVMQDQEFVAFQLKEKAKGQDARKRNLNKISVHSTKTIRFWKTYAQFTLALSQAFPAQKLPVFSAPLEEDVEMRGFLPLRNLMGEGKKSGEKASADGQTREQVHPNVEQLMRISDLLDDARALVKMENTPLLLINNHIVFNLESVEDIPPNPEVSHDTNGTAVPILQQKLLANIRDASLDLHPKHDLDADDMTELTSRTDDDPVRDAFQFLNTSEDIVDDDEDDDEVVYMKSSISPVLSPILRGAPATPVKPLLSPKTVSPRSPTRYQPVKIPSFTLPAVAPALTSTTAQDLLNDVMGLNNHRTFGGSIPPPIESTAPQPKFLFGSELSHRPSHSIWSASRDEQPLMYTGSNVNAGNNGQVTGLTSMQATGNALGGSNSLATSKALASNIHATSNLHSSGNIHGGSIYQTPSHQFPVASSSQDISLSQQSIWSSPYSSHTQNSQQVFVGVLPSAPFAQPPQIGLSGVIGHGGQHQHQRGPSASLSSQLYSNHTLNQINHDPFSYTSPVLQQAPIHRPEPNLSPGYLSSSLLSHNGLQAIGGGPSLGLDIGTGGPSQPYYTNPNQGYHTRQMSAHNPRVGQQAYMSPVMSQAWGNNG